MPTVKDFGTFRICMYFEDENPPHFHIVAPDFQAKIALGGLGVLAGNAPCKVLSEARAWARDHERDLRGLWDAYSA